MSFVSLPNNTAMEHIHGVDVSWMTHGSSKEKGTKSMSRRRNTLQSQSSSPPMTSELPPSNARAASPVSSPIDINGSVAHAPTSPTLQAQNTTGTSPRIQRRPSWFSNLSSKFSSSPGSSPPQAINTPPKQAELSVPRSNPPKNAVLQHAAKHEGEGPYTPAPPKSSSQASLLQVLRRLSTSSGNVSPSIRGNHGMVGRKILNVDRKRERCALPELNEAKLRRVAFCVDVEIAPMPKYDDARMVAKKPAALLPSPAVSDKTGKRKVLEKDSGDAASSANTVLPDKADASKPSMADASAVGAVSAMKGPAPAKAPPVLPPLLFGDDGDASSKAPVDTTVKESEADASGAKGGNDSTRKKDKKKKSEEERKARKERKRRLAEANGSIPMEIYLDSDDSELGSGPASATAAAKPSPPTPRTQATPTTNPVRIYRRCCQLRETPILKKITEQLSDPALFSSETGIVEKLDLTGYWMQLADLVTLGDFLAVVPIREVILENCGLNDEGLRVILSGLLAARKPERKYVHIHHQHHHVRNSSLQLKGQVVPVVTSLQDGTAHQGGFVERMVLKDNKIGVEGWKHICLFVYLCRSLKSLNLCNVVFPQSPIAKVHPAPGSPNGPPMHQAATIPTRPGTRVPLDICQLLAKSLSERLAGSTLELLHFGDTGLTADQLGTLIDGAIKCGIKRLGLAHNDLDDVGVRHVARYLASGVCVGLDLGGNDLRDHMEVLSDAISPGDPLWALSLADCNLKPASVYKLLPKLAKLKDLRFIDLSHNHELFEARPSALALLRRYLPMMESLKRLHLADVAMSSEQAIALAEILPEIKQLAHLSLLQNPELSKLADARTEERQEKACALYASLLAATRLSSSIVAIEMDVPTAESTEIVRAMAKQVLAYCLRNVDRVTLGNTLGGVVGDGVQGDALAGPKSVVAAADGDRRANGSDIEFPDVIQHLVGHDPSVLGEEDDVEAAPNDDYVIGGTGVAQALECCLKNRGSETGRPSGEFLRDTDGTVTPTAAGELAPPSKAKDMSKHLLQSARKIRLRLQPALLKTRASGDNQAYQRLLFLDQTLDGIIRRFEDEFPETRISIDSGVSVSQQQEESEQADTLQISPLDASEPEQEHEVAAAMLSDGEDETDIRPSSLSRSSSVVSLSKGLTNEEGRVLRVGHRFRSGWFKHYSFLSSVEEVGSDPAHDHVLQELIGEIDDEDLNRKLQDKGAVRLFKEDREQILQLMRAQDPAHWERFMESQNKARANLKIELGDGGGGGGGGGGNGDVANTATGSGTGAVADTNFGLGRGIGQGRAIDLVPEDAIEEDATSTSPTSESA